MNIFADAMGFGFDAAETVAGETICYTYAEESEEFEDVVAGETESRETGVGGNTVVASRSCDFLIRREAWEEKFGDKFPTRNNVITRTNGKAYKVFSGAQGHIWRYSGPQNTYLRVHTIEVKKKD